MFLFAVEGLRSGEVLIVKFWVMKRNRIGFKLKVFLSCNIIGLIFVLDFIW